MNRNFKVAAAAFIVVFLSLAVSGCGAPGGHDESRPLLISHSPGVTYENATHLDRPSLQEEIPFLVDALEQALVNRRVTISSQDQIKEIESYLEKHHNDDFPTSVEFEQGYFDFDYIATGSMRGAPEVLSPR